MRAASTSDGKKWCKDCVLEGRTTWRACPYPGPRCATHNRIIKKTRREQAHDNHVVKTYDLQPGQYTLLLNAQNGLCAICGPVTGHKGASKRLAVDHNHTTNEVRGLLCGPCNQIIGLWRDNPEVFVRGYAYLIDPPARRVITNAIYRTE